MDLTLRQQTFLTALVEACKENRGPVHYSVIARIIGVNKFTAYDMLKVLEQKGLVQPNYQLDPDSTGPGRSSVMFAPTPRGRRYIARFGGSESGEPAEWQQAKARLLTRLEQESGTQVDEAVSELAQRSRQSVPPLIYCAEVLSAMTLSLHEAFKQQGETGPLATILSTHWRFNLNFLAGLAVGTAATKPNIELVNRLGDVARRYESALQQLSSERMETLREFVDEMLSTWERRSASNEA